MDFFTYLFLILALTMLPITQLRLSHIQKISVVFRLVGNPAIGSAHAVPSVSPGHSYPRRRRWRTVDSVLPAFPAVSLFSFLFTIPVPLDASFAASTALSSKKAAPRALLQECLVTIPAAFGGRPAMFATASPEPLLPPPHRFQESLCFFWWQESFWECSQRHTHCMYYLLCCFL